MAFSVKFVRSVAKFAKFIFAFLDFLEGLERKREKEIKKLFFFTLSWIFSVRKGKRSMFSHQRKPQNNGLALLSMAMWPCPHVSDENNKHSMSVPDGNS